MQRRCRNAPELLDAPNEYYYAQQTGRLFFYYNGTGKPKGELVATKLQTLIEFKGSQAEPIVNVTLSGLHFRDAAETGMEPHGVPSCGDWALQRTAALFVEGSERLTVDGCSFLRMDGNALMLSKYNRHATISNSEFAFIGEHSIACERLLSSRQAALSNRSLLRRRRQRDGSLGLDRRAERERHARLGRDGGGLPAPHDAGAQRRAGGRALREAIVRPGHPFVILLISSYLYLTE